jgi:signal transduction histidine kinase/CheY-like chemotaxis protein
MFRHISPLLFWTVVSPALAAVYIGAAKLGLSLATTAEQVTAVWPPTGIALAAALLFGYRIWPAIAIGAFAANVTTSESVATACGIAAGNTLEAVLGAWLLLAVAKFDCSLARLRDVLALVVLAAGVSTAVCATIGVTSLCLGGAQHWSDFGSLWGLWWLGDAIGALVVAPLLLTWASGRWQIRRPIEAAALIALLVAVSWLGFGGRSPGLGERTGMYLLFPLVMWAALRFGQRGATTATLVASALAIWSTVNGLGPFGVGLIHERLLSLQLFVGVVATSALLLSAAIAERERLQQDLRRSLEHLKEADRRKDEFLAMLAHELRNPLAPIQSALELFRLPGAGDADLAQAEEILRRQVQHLVRLVDDLLDMARIARGTIELRMERVGLAEIVAQAIEPIRPLISARRHELKVSLPPEPVELEADSTRLAQVISNLLHNAAKYSEPGGQIWLSAERSATRLAIHVRDQGIGIDPEMLPQVFDLFFQAEAGRDRTHGGLGIGLTLVRRLVELHGGQIEAKSAGGGRGSEFTIQLPLATEQPLGLAGPMKGAGEAFGPVSTSSRPAASGAAAGVEQTSIDRPAVADVLIVDDNVDAARTLQRLLASRGHAAHAVFDGPAAVTWAEANRPAVVLLDIGMPKMDGFEVARKIREFAGPNDTLLIALTGWGQEEDRRRSSEAGFQAHLVKPVKLAEIEKLLAARAAVAAR